MWIAATVSGRGVLGRVTKDLLLGRVGPENMVECKAQVTAGRSEKKGAQISDALHGKVAGKESGTDRNGERAISHRRRRLSTRGSRRLWPRVVFIMSGQLSPWQKGRTVEMEGASAARTHVGWGVRAGGACAQVGRACRWGVRSGEACVQVRRAYIQVMCAFSDVVGCALG